MLSETKSNRLGGSLNFSRKRITVLVPVAPNVLLPITEIARRLKFLSIYSLAFMKLSLSLINIVLGRITAAMPVGFNNWAILSINKVSISEPSFDIFSSVVKVLSFNFRCGLKDLTEYGGFATKISKEQGEISLSV